MEKKTSGPDRQLLKLTESWEEGGAALGVVAWLFLWGTGGEHQARGPNPAFHLVFPGLGPCFYLAAAPSWHLTVKQ